MSLDPIILIDPQTGSRAEILASLGFNCYRFQAQVAGQPVELLEAHPNFSSGQERPSGSGIPILFPFGGRLRGTSFCYAGRSFELAAGDGLGNAIHGFVLNRPWRVLEQSGTHVVGQFHASQDDPQVLEQWPADFCITATYTLDANRLACQITVDNPDTRPLPCGLATHAYFRLPLGTGEASLHEICVPAQRHWTLAEMLPTGQNEEDEACVTLRAGRPFAECRFDDVFTNVEQSGRPLETSITDPQSGRRLVQSFDPAFRHCVVYTPGDRKTICLEPYTALPDALNLEDQGIDTGLWTLAPGESRQVQVAISLESV